MLLVELLVGPRIANGFGRELVVVRHKEATLPGVEHLVGLRREASHATMVPGMATLVADPKAVCTILDQNLGCLCGPFMIRQVGGSFFGLPAYPSFLSIFVK